MRPILLGVGFVIAILAADVQPGSAAPRPRCVRDGAFGSGTWDCTYHNLQQCLASASGNGGSCYENPNYRGPERKPARRSSPERRY
jgi:hypothetical protein